MEHLIRPDWTGKCAPVWSDECKDRIKIDMQCHAALSIEAELPKILLPTISDLQCQIHISGIVDVLLLCREVEGVQVPNVLKTVWEVAV